MTEFGDGRLQAMETRIIELEKKVWQLERSHNYLVRALQNLGGDIQALKLD